MIIFHQLPTVSLLLGVTPKNEAFVPFDGWCKTSFDVVEGNNVFRYSLCSDQAELI